MTTGKIVLIALIAGALGVGLAALAPRWLDGGRDFNAPVPVGGDSETDRLDRLPRFQLPDTSGQEIASSHWKGKVLVLNFWATWCPPCLRELPLFDELQRTHSDQRLQVVGIAIDDKEAVEAFLAEHPVAFPILLGNTDAIEISRRLGNRLQGLPFTAIFDHHGQRIYGQTGEMTRSSLAEHLEPLLSQFDNTQTNRN
jgi:thiol-disulfide isomerase/thioredoxin